MDLSVKKALGIAKNGDKKHRKEMIDKLRKTVEQRLQVLDENRNWRGEANEDIRFENFMDQQHLNWMQDDPDRYADEEDVYLYVTSMNRNKSMWPNPNEYAFDLDGAVENIIRAQLVQASFPLVDTTVNDDNHIFRFSVSPFTTIRELVIPNGNYTGNQMAIELTRQMNMNYFSSDILAGTYKIEESTGLVIAVATGTYPVGVDQFRCQWISQWDKFVFQAVDEDLLPTNALVFAVHIDKENPVYTDYRNKTDDIFELLGFQYSKVAEQATLDGSGETYRLVNTTAYTDFGEALSVDARISYSIYGNTAVDLRGGLAMVLDIDPLNDNDVAQPETAALSSGFNIANCFGFLLFDDPSNVTNSMLNVSNNNYPINKYYREGRSRVHRLMVRIRRLDGSLVNFRDTDHIFTIRLTVKRTQPKKSVFTR